MGHAKFNSHLEASSYMLPGGGELYQPLREKMVKQAIDMGYDPTTMLEHGVVWADDQDPFGHIMNAGFSHFTSAANFRLFESFEAQLKDKYQDLFKAKGVGVIVKSYAVDIKRPVAYPDSLIVANRIAEVQPDRYHVHSSIFSLRQQAQVFQSSGWVVFFDYSKGKPANLVEYGGVYKELYEALSDKSKKAVEKMNAWDKAHPKKPRTAKL